jgi:HNH endonuclease
MAFPRDRVSELLARCHRRCCICHRFCGVKMETDHIVPKEEGGDDTIDNAIPVCFECHAEIHSYNDKHPRGRKFLPEELRRHKQQWLKICEEQPDLLVTASRVSDVGPLQALIDELELNAKIAARADSKDQGCRFHEEQLLRAIHDGSIAILRDEIREAVLEAYVAMGAANQLVDAAWRHPKSSDPWAQGVNEARRRIVEAQPKIEGAKEALLKFLAAEQLAT